MKLCIVGKYPPIQGGVSAQTYWLARELADEGHDVHVVTNAPEVESEYRMHLSVDDRRRLEHISPAGGSVRLHVTTEPRHLATIPYANPFVSKLAALAADVVDGHGCDAVLAWYLEPYGFAGALAAQWCDVPLALRHAGSDLGRLAQDPARARAYRELLRGADVVLSGGSTGRSLTAAGVRPDRLRPAPAPSWPDVFTPHGPALDIAAMRREAETAGYSIGRRGATFDPTLPTIGLFGKTGSVKGTPHAIRALGALAERGLGFNLAMLCGAPSLGLRDELRRSRIAERTTMLPFLAPWRVPEFLRACSAVCVLENRFPIAIHHPGTAVEVLSTGTCLVVSEEIRSKQHQADAFVDRANSLVIPDPAHGPALEDALAWVVQHPERAAEAGRAGALLFRAARNDSTPGSAARLIETLSEAIDRRDRAVTLSTFQAVLARLYTSDGFREAVRHADRSVLANEDLSSAERDAIAALVARGRDLDDFAAELHEKAFDFAWRHFPTVERCFPELRHLAFDRFRAGHDFADRGWMENIEHVATFIEAASKQANSCPTCVADAVRYDIAALRASTVPARDDSLGGLHGIASVVVAEPSPSTRWVVGADVLVIDFDHDILGLLAGTVHAEATVRPCRLAFVPPGTHAPDAVLRLPEGVGPIVDPSAEPVTTEAMVDMVAGQMGIDPFTPEFRQACTAALHLLQERGVLVPAADRLERS